MKSFRTYISILKVVKNKPTKYFLYLVLIIVALFMQAYMHNYNIVYIMMFFLVGIAGASSLYGVLNLYHIKVKLLSHERFFALTPSFYTLSLINDSSHSAYDISITSLDEVHNIKSINAQESRTLRVRTDFQQRGSSKLPDIKLSSIFPLPHEIKFKDINLKESLVVYAQPKGISLFSIYNRDSSLNGEMDEFDGLRDFIQGESISYIHWASLAKDETLKSKTFLFEDEQKTLHFNFDTLKGEVEEKLSQLTLWVLECEKYNLAFTLDINAKILDSKEQSIDEILTTIASY
ncbi:MAG: DUF58 domain-containing protein [Campylobacterota bacterium]|nr:DUF58 domain-containing protein [Campylobacterota bacterium]